MNAHTKKRSHQLTYVRAAKESQWNKEDTKENNFYLIEINSTNDHTSCLLTRLNIQLVSMGIHPRTKLVHLMQRNKDMRVKMTRAAHSRRCLIVSVRVLFFSFSSFFLLTYPICLFDYINAKGETHVATVLCLTKAQLQIDCIHLA